MNPDPEHQRRLKKAAEMLVEKQVNMIKQIMIKSAMGVIEGGMEAVQEAKKREWVGLTDEEMHECWGDPLTPLGMKHARLIEAKLKEKNHGS